MLVCGRDPARSLPLGRGFLLIPLVLVCFAFLPKVQAQTVFGEGDIGDGNTIEGFHALNDGSNGSFNTALGWYAQGFNGGSNGTGIFVTAVGAGALDLNAASDNSALGAGALLLNIGSDFNTAVGSAAMLNNGFSSATTATDNVAVGTQALWQNVNAGFNTALGTEALFSNDSDALGLAVNNTAVGAGALFNNTDADDNTAVGFSALFNNTTGLFNDAVGSSALLNNTDGFSNEAFGESALFFNVHGAANTAIGDLALENNDSDMAGMANNNVGVGSSALFFNVDGSENTVVGTGAGPNVVTGFNNTYVGDFVGSLAGTPDESDTIRIGDLSDGNGAGSLECFIGGIFNNFQPVGGSVVEVTLDLTNDHLGWDVGPNQGPSAPVHRGAPQHRSAPQLRERPAAIQKALQRQAMLGDKVEQLQATVAQQQKQIETLTAQLREQAAQIQNVSAQLEMVRPAPRVVENP